MPIQKRTYRQSQQNNNMADDSDGEEGEEGEEEFHFKLRKPIISPKAIDTSNNDQKFSTYRGKKLLQAKKEPVETIDIIII